MVLNSEKFSYPSLEVMDIDKVKINREKFRENLKVGIYKELNEKGLINDREFFILTTPKVRTFEVGHAIMH